MPLRVLLGVLLFGAVLTIGIGAAVSQGDATTYSASQVRGAFDEAGLTVRLAGSAMGGAAFVENRDRFTVVVLPSVAAAKEAFASYERDLDPGTFEARKANVIVLADGSNSDQPLPLAIRTRISTALELLVDA